MIWELFPLGLEYRQFLFSGGYARFLYPVYKGYADNAERAI